MSNDTSEHTSEDTTHKVYNVLFICAHNSARSIIGAV